LFQITRKLDISEYSKGDRMIIAVISAGGHSLKSKIFSIKNKNEMAVLGRADIDEIKVRGNSNFLHRVGIKRAARESVRLKGLEAAVKLVFDWYIKSGIISGYGDIGAVGLKCIFKDKSGACILTKKLLDELKQSTSASRACNQLNIEVIEIIKSMFDVPVAVMFDSSFHYSIPEFRRLSGFPWNWYKKLGIKKRGYDGFSHQYMAAITRKIEKAEKMNLITIYLGESSSICAIKNKRSIDTSMVFSPSSGLLQKNAIGDIDGTALLFAMDELNLSVEEAQNEITKNAGLLATAGIRKGNFKNILSAARKGSKRAKLTVDLYIDTVRKYIGAFSTILGNIDCIVFGGEIGESSAYIREKCLENMDYMGIRLDLARNKELNNALSLISSDYSVVSKTKIYIVPVNGDMVMAYFTKKVIEKGKDLPPEEMTFRL